VCERPVEKCDEDAYAVDPVQTSASRFLFSPRVLFSPFYYSLCSSKVSRGILVLLFYRNFLDSSPSPVRRTLRSDISLHLSSCHCVCWPQWPHGLRHQLAFPTWDRGPTSGMNVCLRFFVLPFVGSGLATGRSSQIITIIIEIITIVSAFTCTLLY
jgi:hypothetical protein